MSNRDLDLKMTVSQRDHIQGSETALVTLVQYGDYECPYTRKSNSVIKEIQAELGDKLRFVYRNFPLTEIHPHAAQAAFAAEAAAMQGKFWEMHDILFAHQHNLEVAALEQYAQQVGLDTTKFNHDLSNGSYAAHIQEDVESGIQSGVQGTPTFFINGSLHVGSWEKDSLAAAIENASLI